MTTIPMPLPRRQLTARTADPSHPVSGLRPLPAPFSDRAPAGGKTSPHRPATTGTGIWAPASPPGVIGGAVITAARRSARLSRRNLARRLTVSTATVRSWENGTLPLYEVNSVQLGQLADTLSGAGALAGCGYSELILASQCDLLITGMLHGFEDYAEIPPIDEETEGHDARSLLRWALTGRVPDQYSKYATEGPLLSRSDATAFAAIARDLQDGSGGWDLASYGTALAELAK
jgi:transcriptional regulator with XRE-family HTH domain